MLRLFLIAWIACVALGDEGRYGNTIAETANDAYTSTTSTYTANMEFKTSNTYLAGTIDTLYFTFIGDFAVSGPHSVTGPSTGSIAIASPVLSRKIGTLQKIHIEKSGTDAWLLSSLSCTMNGVMYLMNVPLLWLDNFDPQSQKLYGNAFEPGSQQTLQDLPAISVLELTVSKMVTVFSKVGVVTTDYQF